MTGALARRWEARAPLASAWPDADAAATPDRTPRLSPDHGDFAARYDDVLLETN